MQARYLTATTTAAKRLRALVSAFVSAGATTPDAAIAFVPDDTTLGRYWLDPERLDSFRSVV